jgi:hypothetical protein
VAAGRVPTDAAKVRDESVVVEPVTSIEK